MYLTHRQQAQNAGVSMASCTTLPSMCGVGFSFALDKIVNFLSHHRGGLEFRSMDVAVCTNGKAVKDVPLTLRNLWMPAIRTGLFEANDIHEAIEEAEKLKVPHVVLLRERGSLCVRSCSVNNEYSEKYLESRQELSDHILKMMSHDPASSLAIAHTSGNSSANNDSSNVSQTVLNLSGGGSGSGGAVVFNSRNLAAAAPVACSTEVTFAVTEKLTANHKRRCENLAMQNLLPILKMFAKKQFVHIVIVSLAAPALRAFAGAIDVRDGSLIECEAQMALAMDMFPKERRKMKVLFEDIVDVIKSRKDPPIIVLYSSADAFYKIIL